jgi:hypothetical protein
MDQKMQFEIFIIRCFKFVSIALVTFLATLVPATAQAEKYKVVSLQPEIAQEYDLDTSFYKKTTYVQGILIATSDKVSDYAHLEAAYLYDKILSTINADVAQRVRDRKVLCILVGHDELTSQIPQFKSDKTGKELDFYNWRSRGFLTKVGQRSVVLFAEEDVMEYAGGMRLESILIHEFGHVVQFAGMDEQQLKKLEECFQRAKAAGIWNDGRAAQRYRRIKGDAAVSLLDSLVESFPDQSSELIKRCLDGGDILVNGKPAHATVKVNGNDKVLIVFGGPKKCYAQRNKAEYWAEVLQCWYDTNRTMDHDHNHIHTREQLQAYDPHAAKLCAEVLSNHRWRFVSPRQRYGKQHLKGYDPAEAPHVSLLPHIEIAALDYYDNYWKEFWQRLKEKHSIE